MKALSTNQPASKQNPALFFRAQNQPPGQTFFTPSNIQPKLTVNRPDDVYEQEADIMADQVMRMPESSANNNSFFKPVVTSIQRKCAHCEEEEKMMQRKEIRNDTPEPSGQTEYFINSLSGGKALNKEERSFFEPRIGYDFSNVRLHTNEEAAQSAKNINALAYTQGNNIVFAPHQYQPATEEGKKLLAHELMHTIQQGNAKAVNHNRQESVDVKHKTEPSKLTVQRQLAPISGQVLNVRMSWPDRRIVFDTTSGSYGYTLDSCSIPMGTYSVSVSTTKTSFNFNFGQGVPVGQRFDFTFSISPGQLNPALLLQGQHQVVVSVVDSLPLPQLAGPTTLTTTDTSIAARVTAFKTLVKNSGKLRLEGNSRALEQWRQFLIQQLTPDQVQTQVHTEEVRSVVDRATHAGAAETAVAEQWLNTSGPNSRWVMEQQIAGRYRACTGCHAIVQANDMDRRLQEQYGPLHTPLQQLPSGPDSGARPSFATSEHLTPTGQPGLFPSVSQAEQRVNAIQPYLRDLGPEKYNVLPRETLGSTATPATLLADINRRITQRQDDYRELVRRIDLADFDYLKLRPIVRDLLPLAEADVRQAIEAEISTAERWETVESVVIGAATLALLLLAIFPPTSAIGVAGVLALGGAVSSYGIYRGAELFDEGQLYSLGRGADNVFDPAQQEAADSMMAMGALNVVLGSVGLASSALGGVRLLRGPVLPSNALGALESVEAREGGNLVRIRFGDPDPYVIETNPSGQVVREGPISTFRVQPSGGPAASAGTGSPTVSGTGGYVYPTEGGAARVAQPLPEPAPVPQPRPAPVPQPQPAPATQPPTPNVSGYTAVTAATATASIVTTAAANGTQRQPVMPTGLSPALQERWRACNQQHNTYKATQSDSAAYSTQIDPIRQRLMQNQATPQDRIDFCRLINEQISIVQRLHAERKRYLDLNCDQFDWFNEGRSVDERIADHKGELDNVDAQLRGTRPIDDPRNQSLYALRNRFCP